MAHVNNAADDVLNSAKAVDDTVKSLGINNKQSTIDFKKSFAKYTSAQREVKRMSHTEFMDYTSFLLRQMDVEATETAREALAVTKNARNIKSYSGFIKASYSIFSTALALALMILIVAAISYYFLYMKGDKVKKSINIALTLVAFCFVFAFAIYIALFYKMTWSIKNIMSLL
jgi:hypothetical protein